LTGSSSIHSGGVVSAEVIQLRDYRRKEEQEAALVRLAKEVMGLIPDAAPCELPGAWPDFYHAPDRDPA
jgi:hypothetical protein